MLKKSHFPAVNTRTKISDSENSIVTYIIHEASGFSALKLIHLSNEDLLRLII